MASPEKEGYLGNPLLKRAGEVVEWDQDKIQEYIKCSQDPIYFAEKYIKIVHVDHGAIPIKLRDYQRDIIETMFTNRKMVLNQARQSGKALFLDTRIPTPSGFKTMGELNVGDDIFGADGKVAKVTFATETMYNHDVYDVEFDTGQIIKADAEHLWTVEYNNKKYTITTEEIIPILEKQLIDGQSVRIPVPKPVEYETNNDNSIHPYILGLWLGDGNKNDGRIYSSIEDSVFIRNKIEQYGYSISENKNDHRNENATRFSIYNIRPKLRELGVLKNKHIPNSYIYTSVEKRLELIRGLMDSDGSVDSKSGSLEFYNKNKVLIEGFRLVLHSLGIKNKLREKEVKGEIYFTVSFASNEYELVTIPRKLEKQKLCKGHKKLKNFYFKSIKKCESVPVKCIQVDNEDHLFLASDSFIPTHNTTTATVMILHYILFNKEKTVALLANKKDTAIEILDRIQFAYQELPKWLQQGVIEWNKGSMKLENGCKVIASSSSASAIRGKAVSYLYIDECAFLENWNEFWLSVYPTISSGKETKVLISSTPKGLNHFYKICSDAQDCEDDTNIGVNGFIYKEVRWDSVPGRDEKWKEAEIAVMNGNVEQFNQEYNCSFEGSTDNLINSETLSSLVSKKPILQASGLYQYEKPLPNHVYSLVADVSRGKGLDYSAFSIIDVTNMPYKQVCVYNNNDISPVDYATIIHTMAKTYNNAMVLIEINDIGGQVADIVALDFGYENILSTQGKGGRGGKRISSGFGRHNDRGIRTTTTVKKIGCSILKLLIEQQQLLLNDETTIYQIKRFVRKGESYEAEKGHNDDLVMTLVLFAWMADQNYFKEMTEINTLRRLRDNTDEEIDNMALPFFFSGDYDGDYTTWEVIS